VPGTLTKRELKLLPAACCPPLTARAMPERDAKLTAAVFRALGDPGRVRIVNLLANSAESVCVCDITDTVGLSQPTVSFHLKKLVSVGLLQREQRGVWAYYRLDLAALRRLGMIFGAKEKS
jgi:ArsR family transcriptional regulator, arsenate/arsenite/antimonite-responsive transcriptional repressor